MLPRRLSRRFFLEARSALAERAAATAASPGSMTLSYEEWRMLAFARSLAAPMSVPRASCSASRLVLVMRGPSALVAALPLRLLCWLLLQLSVLNRLYQLALQPSKEDAML